VTVPRVALVVVARPASTVVGRGKLSFICINLTMLTEFSHRKSECTEPLKPRAGGGGGRTCFNCLQPGHNVSECIEPRVERCRNCDAEGHHSRDCDKPKDWSRIKCTNCSKYGHGAKRCPEPAGGADSAATGSWGAPGDSSAAAAAAGGTWDDDVVAGAQESTGDWADQATAAAQW
jgi:hypothetical protein